jgi:uncharacterized protein (TIGR03083 family)
VAELGDAYAGCRARVAGLTRDLDAAAAATPVPTCPAWTVHDVVAHLSGVVVDVANGNLDGLATEPWTAAQVGARRDRTVAEILTEWDAHAPAFEGLLDGMGEPGHQAVADAVTHEHDIRTALGRPGERASAAVGIGFGMVARAFAAASEGRGVAVRLEPDGGDALGPADAPVVLRGDRFELLRALTGRRSPDQLRALGLPDGDAAVLAAFTYGPFHPAAAPVAE